MNELKDFPLWKTAPIIINNMIDKQWRPQLVAGEYGGSYTLTFLPPEILYAIPEEEQETFDLILSTVTERLMGGTNYNEEEGPTTHQRIMGALESFLFSVATPNTKLAIEHDVKSIIDASCYGDWKPIIKGCFGIEPFEFEVPKNVHQDVYHALFRSWLGRYRYMDGIIHQ